MTRPVVASIDLLALRQNLQIVRRAAPGSRLWAVVKANAYGHGVARVWSALSAADGFALLNLEEAILLREQGWKGPILLLEGFFHADELAVLDGGKCILQLRGVRPFLSDKYDLTQHPNYKYTSDYDPKNALDIEKFLNRKEKIHPDDTFIMVDADSLPPA